MYLKILYNLGYALSRRRAVFCYLWRYLLYNFVHYFIALWLIWFIFPFCEVLWQRIMERSEFNWQRKSQCHFCFIKRVSTRLLEIPVRAKTQFSASSPRVNKPGVAFEVKTFFQKCIDFSKFLWYNSQARFRQTYLAD